MSNKKAFRPPEKAESSYDGRLDDYIKEFQELKAIKDEIDRLKKDLAEQETLKREQTVKCLELLDRAKLKNLPVKGLGLFYRGKSIHPKTLDEDALFRDLKARKLGSLIKNTVHYKTLQSLISEMQDKGEWEARPLDGVEVYEEPYVGFRAEGAARSKAKA